MTGLEIEKYINELHQKVETGRVDSKVALLIAFREGMTEAGRIYRPLLEEEPVRGD